MGETAYEIQPVLVLLFLTNAVLSIRSKLKASVADALKAPLCVDTAAVATHHSIHNTLINV